MDLKSNIESVIKRIGEAALRSGRRPEDVKLVAVSKRIEAGRVIEALSLGLDTFGENYAQELRDKRRVVEEGSPEKAHWHFIGSLQKNKVKYLVGSVELIHSLDSLSVSEEINKRAVSAGEKVSVLIEVNAGEDSKGGVGQGGLEGFLEEVSKLDSLQVKGLMTMPPYSDDPEQARPYFRALREMRDGLKSIYPGLTELSMGMSGDFEVAIEEGATIVRVGTSIFGPRDN